MELGILITLGVIILWLLLLTILKPSDEEVSWVRSRLHDKADKEYWGDYVKSDKFNEVIKSIREDLDWGPSYTDEGDVWFTFAPKVLTKDKVILLEGKLDALVKELDLDFQSVEEHIECVGREEDE